MGLGCSGSGGPGRQAGRPPTSGRQRAGLAAVVAVLALAPTTTATAQPIRAVPLGGELLGSRGTVVRGSPGTPAPPRNITASGWVLADMTTGEVLAAHDAHGRFAPASTLKALTALTLIPRLDPARKTTVTNADVDVDGSRVGLVPAYAYRVDQLFTALLVASGNDAANALAAAAGGTDYAVALMNEEAERLQATDTTARTVEGLDAPGQTSSAYDLALIGRAGMALPAFRRYVAIRRTFIPAPKGGPIELDNHNKLLHSYAGAIGVKNGYTIAAGATLIAAATRGGRTLEVTFLHAKPPVWHEAAALLDWGFATADRLTPVGRLVDPLPQAVAATAAEPSGPPASSTPAPTGNRSALPQAWWDAASRRALAGGAVGVVLAVAVVGVLLRRRSRQLRYR